VEEHVPGERLTHAGASRGEEQRAGEVVRGVPLPAWSRPQWQHQRCATRRRTLDHASEIAGVVTAEIGVDEKQEVGADLKRLAHEQLHVGTLTDTRARRLQHHLRDGARPSREAVQRVVVAGLVGERELAVVRRTEHRRPHFDAIGQLHDSFCFVAGRDADQETSQGFPPRRRARPPAAERAHDYPGGGNLAAG